MTSDGARHEDGCESVRPEKPCSYYYSFLMTSKGFLREWIDHFLLQSAMFCNWIMSTQSTIPLKESIHLETNTGDHGLETPTRIARVTRSNAEACTWTFITREQKLLQMRHFPTASVGVSGWRLTAKPSGWVSLGCCLMAYLAFVLAQDTSLPG